jgi:lipopolysaccharide/colanic/teichoic acid biosynthesis glycosyltransferase
MIFKRTFDFLASLLSLFVICPLLLVIAILIKIKMADPVFFTQKRVGRHGKLFTLVKFRTMTVGHCGSSVSVRGENRITPLGAVLRKYKLDELPELWNVLKGEMSFVGPRPDVPGYADRLQGDDCLILELYPGITGPATLKFREEEKLLAQVPDPQRYNDKIIFPEKVRLNLEYMEHWSFWKDMGYIFLTVMPGLARKIGLDRRLGLEQ